MGLPTATVHAQASDALSLTLPQARSLAAEALRDGELILARDIAMGLVQANPKDAYAYSVLTAVYRVLGDPKLSRAAARLHYKYAQNQEEKFHAAHVAGQVAFDQERLSTAQIWLRRAALHAQTPQQDAQLARDYRAVRRKNPFRISISASVTPSDNVNNGASSAVETVNGAPTFAILAPGSLALSGTVATLNAQASYRLNRTQTSQSTIGARFYTRQVRLSDEAREQDPTRSNNDFGVTYVDASFDYAFALGKPGNSAGVRVAAGRVWAADSVAYDLTQMSLRRGLLLSPKDRLSLEALGEFRNSARSSDTDATVLRLTTTYRRAFENSDRASLAFRVEDVVSDARNASFGSWSVRAGYDFGKQLGPVRISTGVTFGNTNYDTFERIGPVPGGRQDETFGADLTILFPNLDYAGFAPSMNVRATRTTSNVSRYSTEELSVGFGIQSKF
ncbi:MAG: hypothetical protein AAF754_07625 [Pseudomonadota bacterium]